MSEFEKVVIGDAILYCGDCRHVLPTLAPVDALITDPPYGVDFSGKETKQTKPSGGYLGVDDPLIGPTCVSMALSIAQRAIVFSGVRLIFDYPKPHEIGGVYCPSGAGRGRWGFMGFNPMLYYGKALMHGVRSPNSFESFDLADSKQHPCAKPLRWMKWAVNKATLPGQTVLDPFMGSGTTGAACAEMKRAFIGIELEREYFDLACRRIEEAQRQTDFLPPMMPAISEQSALL
jgi:site-specific DNA-methyltransferase (adenine-specific)/modification methylase